MARIVSNFFISLDGVVEAPHEWHFPYFDDEMGRIVGKGMESARAFLMGRNLYREWAEYWPQQDEKDVEFASYINTVPKYVLSHHDGDADWQNTTVITGPTTRASPRRSAHSRSRSTATSPCPAARPRCGGSSPRACSTSWRCSSIPLPSPRGSACSRGPGRCR